MTQKPTRQLKLGAILAGVGTDHTRWRDPALPGDASIDINWYIDNARLAEAAKFDLVFIVDSPFITPDTAPALPQPPGAPDAAVGAWRSAPRRSAWSAP